eukprot:TRINITY_DN4998_c0_g3_i1.p1 TRINITY_DN4998_c0_g3~~TRINITY_DN4998_c0_g3_i1.p1  ORF type:complete len:134 (+),score=29.60 TRINITY_DN4998_c0_g3_i1:193-594(+)
MNSDPSVVTKYKLIELSDDIMNNYTSLLTNIPQNNSITMDKSLKTFANSESIILKTEQIINGLAQSIVDLDENSTIILKHLQTSSKLQNQLTELENCIVQSREHSFKDKHFENNNKKNNNNKTENNHKSKEKK